MRLCAVIPAYNEEAHVAGVVERTRPQVERVLVVDDGSRDETAARAREAGAEVLVHETNRGKGASLRDGLDRAAEAGFEAAILLDADGQHLPEEIPRFAAAAAEADLVIGNRMAARAGMPFVRWHTNRVMSRIISSLAGAPIADSQVGFRLLRCAAWRLLQLESSNFDFESEMLVAASRAGLRIASVPVSTVYQDEVSKISPVRDTVRFVRLVWRLWRKRG